MKALLCLALVACASGATPHQKALMAGMATLDAAKAGFEVYDNKHQSDIVEAGTSGPGIKEQLAAYRAKRDTFVNDVVAATKAIDAAWKLDTDPSVATAVAAIAAVGQALVTLGVTK